MPARAFVNVGIASTPWKNPRVTVAFDVKNVLDVQSQDLDGYPLPPRAAFLWWPSRGTPGATSLRPWPVQQ